MLQNKRKLLNMMLYGYGGLMLLLIGMSTGARLLNSDVLFQDSVWVIALDIIMALVDAFAFAFACATVIYGIYLIGNRAMITVYAAFLAVTTFHYVAILCIGWAIYPGTLPDLLEDWLLMAVESLFLYILIDCLRLFAVGFVTCRVLSKHETARVDYNRKARILAEPLLDARSIAFPLTKFISFKNPVQIGAVMVACVYWTVFFIQYAYYAAMNLIKLKFWEYIGFQIAELGFYAVMACVCYCITIYMIMKLDEKMPKTEE